MKENWNRSISSFQEEINRASEATGEEFGLTEEQKKMSLIEFAKVDRARLRAFVSILNKLDSQEAEYDFSRELKTVRALDAVDSFVEKYEKGEHSTLEPRQVESLAKIARFLRSGEKRGYLELPTGLGKTVIFSELIEALKDIPDMKILVAGSGNINTIQNVQKIEQFGGGEVGRYFAGSKSLDTQVVVCNYHGLRLALKSGNIKSGDFDLVLLDEAHDGIGEVTQSLFNEVFKNETLIGFSATATFKLSRGNSVVDFLPVEIDRMKVSEAVEMNLLAGFKVEVVRIPSVVKGVRVVGGDYIPNELEKQINTSERNDFIVNSYIEFYRNSKSMPIAFTVGRQHSKDLALAFERQGIRAGVLTGELSIDERESVLQEWKNREIEVLCGSKLAWQGLDETEANICLNVTPSLSEKDVMQRGGRVLRRSHLVNRKKAVIVEYLDDWRDTKNRPLFYSELVETAEVEPKKWKDEEEEVEVSTKEKEEPDQKPEREKKESIHKSKLVRYTDTVEVMNISNSNRRFRNEGYYEYAPKNWMSSNLVALELGITSKEVDAVILELQEEMSASKLRANSGTYLSALGIKRIFYSPEIIDLAYTRLTHETRSQKIAKGEIAEISDYKEAEQLANEKESLRRDGALDLDWRDYELLPSFTLEGESLDDELEGTAIGDTSELYRPGEPIDTPLNDLIGYNYIAHHGAVTNSKRVANRPKTERELEITERFGLHADEKRLAEIQGNTDPQEDRENIELLMRAIEDKEVLDERERLIIKTRFFEDKGKTLEAFGQELHTGIANIRRIEGVAIKKLRHTIRAYQNFGRLI